MTGCFAAIILFFFVVIEIQTFIQPFTRIVAYSFMDGNNLAIFNVFKGFWFFVIDFE